MFFVGTPAAALLGGPTDQTASGHEPDLEYCHWHPVQGGHG